MPNGHSLSVMTFIRIELLFFIIEIYIELYLNYIYYIRKLKKLLQNFTNTFKKIAEKGMMIC